MRLPNGIVKRSGKTPPRVIGGVGILACEWYAKRDAHPITGMHPFRLLR